MQSGELSSLQAPQTCPSHISPQSCKIRREALGFLLIHCDGVSFEGSQELFHVLNTNSGFFLNIISDCGNKTCIGWSRGWAYSLQSFEIYTRIICTQNLLKSGGLVPPGDRDTALKSCRNRSGALRAQCSETRVIPLAFEHRQPKLRGGVRFTAH